MIDLNSNYTFIFIILSCVLGLIYSFIKSKWILNQDQGNNEIKSSTIKGRMVPGNMSMMNNNVNYTTKDITTQLSNVLPLK